MEKICAVCGKPLVRQQRKYCSKKCMGLGKQGYKICISCGKQFKSPACDMVVCCSTQCSRKHRQELHNNGIYDETMNKLHEGFRKKVNSLNPGEMWTAKGWVIQSPDGQIYECRNLKNFIQEHPDLFDGTTRQAVDGFVKIKASYLGKRKNPCYTWKGWKLISWSD